MMLKALLWLGSFVMAGSIAPRPLAPVSRAERPLLPKTKAPGETWTQWALELTGESEKDRMKARRNLRRDPQLDTKLRSALQGRDRFLALDVIAVLQRQSLLPDLLTLAETDSSGFVYLALNTLFNDVNTPDLVAIYEKRLWAASTSVSAKVVLLDTLGRLQVLLPPRRLRSLWQKEQPYELRSAVLAYVRSVRHRLDPQWVMECLRACLRSDPFQLRVQALYFLSEWPAAQQNQWSEDWGRLTKDPSPEVRQVLQQRLQNRLSNRLPNRLLTPPSQKNHFLKLGGQ